MIDEYPQWLFYPAHVPPPNWVYELIEVVRSAQSHIDSRTVDELRSDQVLGALRPGLEELGYVVEQGKKQSDKIRRPVLFGSQGQARVTYEVDAAHDGLGVVVEVEAGRGARSNATYRDLVRTSLIVDARYLALGVMIEYRPKSAGPIMSYRDVQDQLDAIYASGRLRLPFEGVLLFGY